MAQCSECVSGQRALTEASAHGQDAVVSFLIDNGAITNSLQTFVSHIAQQRLVDRGVQTEFVAIHILQRCTPLHGAAEGGHVSVVSLLIAKGANVNITNVTVSEKELSLKPKHL